MPLCFILRGPNFPSVLSMTSHFRVNGDFCLLAHSVIFFALVDYVSRIRPPSVASIISEPIAWIFFSNFSCCFPGPYARACFEFLKKELKNVLFFFFVFLRICFVFVNMGPYGSKNFKRLLLQLTAKIFHFCPEFSLPVVLTKLHSWFLKFSVSDF